MKTTLSLSLATLIALTALNPVFAQDTKPSEESVRQLLEAMHTGESFKDAFTHMGDMLRASTKDMNGRTLNAAQQKIRDETQSKVFALMRQQLDWSSTLEPIMVESYRDAFTQQEVNALLKFYRSPIGKSVAEKIPSASQQTVKLMQQRIRDLLPQIQEIERDSAARIRAAADAPESPPPSPQQQPAPPPPH